MGPAGNLERPEEAIELVLDEVSETDTLKEQERGCFNMF